MNYFYLKSKNMELFKSGNPTLNEKAFKNTGYIDEANAMTISGTLNKFGFMFLMLLGTAYYSWKEFAQGGNVQTLIWGGAIGGLVVALVIVFKKEWAPYLAPLYALLQGLFIGAISATYNEAFAKKAQYNYECSGVNFWHCHCDVHVIHLKDYPGYRTF